MPTRTAACSCGQLSLEAEGEPFHVSICHCTACQRRTGSAFGMQAGYRPGQITVSGRSTEYPRTSDEADRKLHVFHFCPDCGSTLYYTEPDEPELVVVMTGTFADPDFPMPITSGYHLRRHRWIGLPEEIATDDPWAEVHPLYEAGDYEAAAARGRQLLAKHPGHAPLAYNVACCESLAGQGTEAIVHLGQAIEGYEEFRTMAAGDSDFDAVRDEPGFRELVG